LQETQLLEPTGTRLRETQLLEPTGGRFQETQLLEPIWARLLEPTGARLQETQLLEPAGAGRAEEHLALREEGTILTSKLHCTTCGRMLAASIRRSRTFDDAWKGRLLSRFVSDHPH
jgi:hypothetical protein